MNKIFTYLIFAFALTFCSTSVNAQLDVNENNSPEFLVQSLLGEGVEVLSVSLNCPEGAVGTFSSEFTNLGLENGVLLTSGSIDNAIGPNDQSSASTSTGSPGDADLDSLIPGFSTNDACVLEITFIPYGETLSFNYVFGSEEYAGYVCSTFNDVFGFFIEGGPEYASPTNIAIIPDSDLPVSINSVNIGTPDGPSEPCFLDNTEYYVDNGSGAVTLPNSTIQYDGFTVVLPATTPVTACEEYTIKLAVADAGDTALDSGVFIEAGSFSVNSFFVEATTTLTTIEGFDYTVEECIDGIITFSQNFVSDEPATINFELGGTAENGVDYEFLESSITIEAGETEVDLVVQTIDDGITEEPEFLTISITNDLGCDTALVQLVELEIVDPTPIFVSEDVEILQGESAQLFVEGGGLNYFWSPAESLDNFNSAMPIAMPTETTTYTVTSVLGDCFYTEQVTVNVLPFQCDSDAGVFTNTDRITVCDGGSFSISADDYMTAAVDTFDSVIAIHTVGDDSVGEVLAVSTEDAPTFDLSTIEGLEYNTIYYVSRVIDLQDETGMVDLENGLCVQVAVGPELVYLAPIEVIAEYDCDNTTGTFSMNYSFTGGLPAFDETATYTVAGDATGEVMANANINIGYLSGSLLNISVTDANGCSGAYSNGPLECIKCQAVTGDILANSPVAICEESSFIPIIDGTNIASENVEEFCGLFSSDDLSVDNLIYIDEDCEFTFEEVSALGDGPFFVGNFTALVDDNGEIDYFGCTEFTETPIELIFGLSVEVEFDCQGPPYAGVFAVQGVVGNATFLLNGEEIEGENNVYVVDSIEAFPITIEVSDPFGCSLEDEYDFGEACITAVELVSFRGVSQEAGNLLLWQTATEISSDFFTLEKSKNGIDFAPIAIIETKGSESAGATYEFFDEDSNNAITYYRLLETDLDGKIAYSDVIVLNRVVETNYDIYPNPVDDVLNVDIEMDKAELIEIAIYDLSGKQVEQLSFDAVSGINQLNIATSNLPTGMFLLEIITSNSVISKKLIKR